MRRITASLKLETHRMTPDEDVTTMLSDRTVRDLLNQAAAGTPVPGGGSLTALVAALGAALAQMVANLTIGRPRFAAVASEMAALAERAQDLHRDLLADMERDVAAYTRVMQAYRLPQETTADKRRRREAVQTAMQEAARVPLTVAEKALTAMELALTAVRSGNPSAAADGVVGAMLARAGLQGALFNVRVNLRELHDKEVAAPMAETAAAVEERAQQLEAAIMALVP
jgi:formiminotetrahydrofolate cyclodeaminase